jgi:hypothetical protein
MSHNITFREVSCWTRQYKQKPGTIRFDNAGNFHAIDLAAALFRQKRNAAGATVRGWRSGVFLASDITFKEKNCLISFRQVLILIMRTPSILLDPSRQEFARILHAFYAGDSEICQELRDNVDSSNLINVLAREALKADRAAAAGQPNDNSSTSGNRRGGDAALTLAEALHGRGEVGRGPKGIRLPLSVPAPRHYRKGRENAQP